MKVFSEKVRYGVAAMFELAKNYPKEAVQIKDISSAQEIPQSYLEQFLLILKRENLVESTRGAKGGYKLKKPPEEIEIIDIILALEGDFEIIDAKSITNMPAGAIFNFWKKSEEQMKEILGVSLEALVIEENSLHERIFYSI